MNQTLEQSINFEEILSRQAPEVVEETYNSIFGKSWETVKDKVYSGEIKIRYSVESLDLPLLSESTTAILRIIPQLEGKNDSSDMQLNNLIIKVSANSDLEFANYHKYENLLHTTVKPLFVEDNMLFMSESQAISRNDFFKYLYQNKPEWVSTNTLNGIMQVVDQTMLVKIAVLHYFEAKNLIEDFPQFSDILYTRLKTILSHYKIAGTDDRTLKLACTYYQIMLTGEKFAPKIDINNTLVNRDLLYWALNISSDEDFFSILSDYNELPQEKKEGISPEIHASRQKAARSALRNLTESIDFGSLNKQYPIADDMVELLLQGVLRSTKGVEQMYHNMQTSLKEQGKLNSEQLDKILAEYNLSGPQNVEVTDTIFKYFFYRAISWLYHKGRTNNSDVADTAADNVIFVSSLNMISQYSEIWRETYPNLFEEIRTDSTRHELFDRSTLDLGILHAQIYLAKIGQRIVDMIANDLSIKTTNQASNYVLDSQGAAR